jgi:P4 family phage/plasmid primase-like protien
MNATPTINPITERRHGAEFHEPFHSMPEINTHAEPASEGNGASPAAALLPNTWFAKRYPAVHKRHGNALQIKENQQGNLHVADISEDFFAGTLGSEGSPKNPTVFVPEETRFYAYNTETGLYAEQTEHALAARLSPIMLQCAREAGGVVDTGNLNFRFRKTAALRGVLQRAKGLLAVPHNFFDADLDKQIPCANGLLRLAELKLLPFSPAARRRNKLAVAYQPGAQCPRFLDTLMKPALCEEDIDLLQRWCGLALVGTNLAQVVMLLTGTAGGGKGTFIRVLRGIIGPQNMATLRTTLLGTRFELGRFLGRTLLYGADVAPDFLNCASASVLKSLTGADPVTLEFKSTNARPEIVCAFNVILTSNTHLRVRLQGDADAWRRRLRIVRYENPPPEKVIADLSEVILHNEAPGVLNWMLEGLRRVRDDGWRMGISPRQQKIVDDLLTECESHVRFVRDSLRKHADGSLTVDEIYERFCDYCVTRGWDTMPKAHFSSLAEEAVRRELGASRRNDIAGPNGKAQRGWKGIGWK